MPKTKPPADDPVADAALEDAVATAPGPDEPEFDVDEPTCTCGQPDQPDVALHDDDCELHEGVYAEPVEVLTGELLPAVPEPGTASAHAAIEAAAQAALEQPGIPGRDEFLSLAMQARMMAGSSLVPKDLKGKPADVFLVLLTGRDVGIPVTSALRKVYVVDGQPSLAPQLKLALVRRQGLGLVRPVPGGSCAWQAAEAVGPNGDTLGPPVTVTWDDVRGNLVGLDCRASEDGEAIVHTELCSRRPREGHYKDGLRVVCKDNWRNYPRRMLWWRAAGYAVDDYFPEVGLGLYSPDELGSVTDEDGRPIDPALVELPEGFEQAERATAGAARQQQAQQQATAAASDDELAELQLRIEALPDEVRAQLSERWKANERLGPLAQLTAQNVTLAKSMVAGFESMARRDGWDADAARAEVLARRADVAAEPEGEPEPDTDAGVEPESEPEAGGA